jgi:hypothetical protein
VGTNGARGVCTGRAWGLLSMLFIDMKDEEWGWDGTWRHARGVLPSRRKAEAAAVFIHIILSSQLNEATQILEAAVVFATCDCPYFVVVPNATTKLGLCVSSCFTVSLSPTQKTHGGNLQNKQ